MKTGTNTGTIIYSKKLKPVSSNCKTCINKYKNRCRFNWEPINGKCVRYSANDYCLTKDERNEIIKQQKERSDRKKTIYNTSLKRLSEKLGTEITLEMIENCNTYRKIGNGKFLIICLDKNKHIIQIKTKKNQTYKFKIIT